MKTFTTKSNIDIKETPFSFDCEHQDQSFPWDEPLVDSTNCEPFGGHYFENWQKYQGLDQQHSLDHFSEEAVINFGKASTLP